MVCQRVNSLNVTGTPCLCIWRATHRHSVYFSNGLTVSKVHPCTGTEALYRPYGPWGSRGMALLFLDHDTRRGWGFNSTVLEITWSKLKMGDINCIAIMVSYCLSRKLPLKYTWMAHDCTISDWCYTISDDDTVSSRYFIMLVNQSINQSINRSINQSTNQSRTRFLSLFLSVTSIRLV